MTTTEFSGHAVFALHEGNLNLARALGTALRGFGKRLSRNFSAPAEPFGGTPFLEQEPALAQELTAIACRDN